MLAQNVDHQMVIQSILMVTLFVLYVMLGNQEKTHQPFTIDHQLA